MVGKKSDKSKRIKYLQVLFIWIVVLLLYHPFLSIYFSGDDFFHFKVSMTNGSLSEFLKLFGFYSFDERGIAFYRPLFREALFNIYYSVFGLNALPFRLTQLILHFGNVALVYIFFDKYMNKTQLSFFISFFYGITAGQVGSLYYLAGGVQAQGAVFFMMITLISWLIYLKNGRYNLKLLSILSFTLSLMSHELAVVTPVLLLLLSMSVYKDTIVKSFGSAMKDLLIPFLVVITYIFLNYFVIGFSNSEVQYRPNLSIASVMNTVMWYGLWSFGLPEMLVDYVGSGFSLNSKLMIYWGDYFKVIFTTFFVSVIILFAGTIYLVIKNVKAFVDLKFIVLLLWFFIALLPVIFLPIHKKTYYLATCLPAFWGVVGYLVFSIYDNFSKDQKIIGKLIITVLSISLFILSYTSIKISNETYWAAKRGRLAEKLTKDIKDVYPELPKGSVLYIKNDPNYPNISGDWGGSSTQASYILNGSDALQLLYDDTNLIVYYEDMNKIQCSDCFEYTAKLD